MLIAEVAAASAEVGATSSRLTKRARIAEVLSAAPLDEVPIIVAWLSGELPQRQIGVGWAALRAVPKAAERPSLSVGGVHDAFTEIGLAGQHDYAVLDIKEDEVPKYHVDGRGGQVMVSKIDKKGTLSKELLFDTREEDIMIFPADFSRINGNQFIGRAKLKRNLYQPIFLLVLLTRSKSGRKTNSCPSSDPAAPKANPRYPP